ncbi:MAG: DUF4124 domain-containing protein [Proteobacteria bacterium]|nr:DUF4124 domain-containing protein [Pseudomonadota bacterium]
MKSKAFYSLIVLACLVLAGTATAADTYRWVDDNGIVHYGDTVPSEYARQDQQVLNSQGVTINTIQGYRTPEQLAEQARIRIEQERIARNKAKRQARDSVLLSTYLSVEEIERLRDRRLELLRAQSMVTEQYLGTLNARLRGLQEEATKFNYPYDLDSDLPPLPENLAMEMVQTLEAVVQYESNLQTKREEQGSMVAMFDRDIERFKDLKGIE